MKRIVIFVVATWIIVSTMLYRFRHPEQTETQLFLNLFDAITLQP